MSMSSRDIRTRVPNLKTLAGAAIALAAVLSLTSCDDNADQTGTDVTFLVTTPTWDVTYAPLAVALEYGYYEDEGINVEYATFAGATTTATQLEQGAGDVALLAPEPIVIGHSTDDFEAVYYAHMFRRTLFDVATFPGGAVQEPEDLEDASIGVTALDSSGAQIAQGLAAEYGVDPESLNMVEIGAGPQAVAAVNSGAVDALSLFDSQYELMRNNDIAVEEIPSEFVDELNAGGLAALPHRLDEDPGLYEGIARALFRGMEFCQDEPEECVQAMWDMEPASQNTDIPEEEALEEAVEVMQLRLENSYSLREGEYEWGSFPDGTWEHYLDYMELSSQVPEGTVNPDELFDDALVQDFNDF